MTPAAATGTGPSFGPGPALDPMMYPLDIDMSLDNIFPLFAASDAYAYAAAEPSSSSSALSWTSPWLDPSSGS